MVKTEYKKGVFFIRLIGRPDNAEYLEKIKDLIEDFGIKYTLLNITKTNSISLNNIKKVINTLQLKKHHLIICDEKRKDQIIPITNEIDAFSLIKRKEEYGQW